MKKNQSFLSDSLIIKGIIASFVFLFVSIFASYIVSVIAWIGPPDNPVDGNVSAPVNISDAVQVKDGPLAIALNDASLSQTAGGPNGEWGFYLYSGDLVAPQNKWGTCATLGWTCNASQTCPDGRFVTMIERGTTLSLCGSAPTQWYQMRIRCCDI